MYAGRKDGFLFFSWCGVEVLSTGLDRKFICLLHRIKYKFNNSKLQRLVPPIYFKTDYPYSWLSAGVLDSAACVILECRNMLYVVVFLLNFCDFRVNREMGWKAAEKLIRHWKILRGDNVSQPIQTHHIFINFTFFFIL